MDSCSLESNRAWSQTSLLGSRVFYVYMYAYMYAHMYNMCITSVYMYIWVRLKSLGM